jgi:hypothetical protein
MDMQLFCRLVFGGTSFEFQTDINYPELGFHAVSQSDKK